ncbi:MAG: adenosylcobinamide-GDP ribazoletransferase [Bacteroidetes bacterium]|nr:adenosylcobinamide-GDP ribazoletransferase [Bacteroidota bacterium]MBU1486071.1 adenosylcobinamide-GDP ribazoletransferase [Bacteroidota bacterium]MBU2045163.1 adenosylcobinamide-GDP ribazoletransferase [Bacteroidota bacterium]MBU2267643.1 adenosylcobinamide-GDP ribazoletransferase [Bacteroidota bacterium]MBU2374457.1 adenosylcobinamide-GDP ribazoletransferase [Bacteroidota bacterium]
MKKEIRIFFTALMFFTRIPCPSFTDHDPEYLNRSSKYFTLVGIIVGSISAIAFYLFQFVFSLEIALLLSFATSLLTTGAFHEDGFADVCDGFGGGWTKEKIMDIMKDSRVGTYGLVGLMILLALKFTSLREIPLELIIPTIISAHAISRLTSVTLIYTDEYAREDLLSKAKPLATKMQHSDYLVACIFGLAPVLLMRNYWVFLAIIPLILTKLYFSRYFNKWIGGYTGDCLGTVQQVAEVIYYLSLLVIFKFIS